MTNPNEPAYPEAVAFNANGEPFTASCYFANCSGLTKREYFAAMAMQGLYGLGGEAALAGYKAEASRLNEKRVSQTYAREAVEAADALIEALNKPKP